MKHEPVKDHAERKRLLALIERCEKEQTMSHDLIRRSDVLKVLSLYGWTPIDGLYDTLAHDIPSADRPQGWIPCSERLPSEQGQYLVTFPLCNGEPWVYILSFNKGKFYETDDEWGDVEYDDVTAWMPLPKPWKGADDE